MKHRVVGWLAILAAVAIIAAPRVYAQGGATSTLSGVVSDTSGAVIPGADVSVRSDTTGTVFTAVTDASGVFTIPAIPPGSYTATITLQGFKTAVLKDIVVNAGVPASVKGVLELGGLEETVIVAGASEVVQTQRTAVATTLTERQIMNIPVPGRAAFDLVSLLPGVASSTGSIRDSSVNGLPQSSVNITLDGMNIQDNYAKSWDGMFTRVSPRLDAVEEVTVATASQGSDMSGQGAVQIRFVTRSGTNQFLGSAYYYMRRDWMNTNTWFNLNRNVNADGVPQDKPVVKQYQPGGRLGGPIIRNKAFFFVNYELVRTPGTRGDTRTIMSPLSEQGVFQYGAGSVNLLELAARSGHVATIDPTIGRLLADVRAATQTTGTVSNTNDPLVQSYFFQQPTKGETKYPTVKLDYNITTRHRATFSTTRNNLLSNPDTTNNRQLVFPGFPFRGLQDSKRYTMQGSVRSVLTSNLVNEFRFGATGGPTKFSPDITPEVYNAPVGNMGGYGISWSAFRSINNTYTTALYSAREGSTKVLENTLSWVRGRHNLSMGASVTRADVWLQNKQHVPTLTLGMATGDPADTMFNTANFPGASGTDLTNARNLYAVLTGRITTIGRDARIGPDGQLYQILGESMQEGRLWDLGFHVQDSWRWRPDLTVNAGLRYAVQMPFTARNNSYSMATVADLFGRTGPGSGFVPGSLVTGTGNLFRPGVFEGQPTTYKLLEAGTKAYNTDWNNFAPSVGAAWTLGWQDAGWKRTVFGRPGESVLRGGYNLAYQRGGMSDFVEVFGNNPGIQIDATRNLANGNLGPLPVLLRSSDLGPPAITLERRYPMEVPSASSNVRVFDPDIKVPWASSFSIGLERKLARDMSAEIRFVRTDSWGSWTLGNLDGLRNYNELNIIENGFINEFRTAQANLVANVEAGRGNTFAFTGVPGTSPLPIFFAHLNTSGAATNPASYTGTGWTNTTLVQSMFRLNPNPFTAASQLRTNATFRTNMRNAGLPHNFWVVNPDVNNAQMIANGGNTAYNGIQLVLNRRFAGGLMAQANYSFADGSQDEFYSFRKPYKRVRQSQTRADLTGSSGQVTHALALNWVYELPFGQNRRFASNVNPWVNRIIGDWSFQGIGRFQSGRIIDYGNVRMVGFNEKDLQNMYTVRKTTDPNNRYRTLVWILPEEVIDNTIKAFSLTATGYAAGEPTGRYFAPANGPDCLEIVNGYGDCGTGSLVVTGPMVMRWDVNFVKQMPVAGRLRLEYQLQIFNVFNRVNFNPNSFIGTVRDSYQVTGAVDQSRTAQMAFRVTW
jgi:hypothetical protein